MSDQNKYVCKRGFDLPMKFECGWDNNGMLFLEQDQCATGYRTGDDKKPRLVFHAEEVPALMAAIKAAAAEGVQEIAGDIRHHQAVLAELRALADEPLPPVTPERPAKKKGGAAP